MRETVFTVKKLEDGWEWQDVDNEYDLQDYCEEELEIPHDSISRLDFYEKAFAIRLKRDKKEQREDWYVNLQRISA